MKAKTPTKKQAAILNFIEEEVKERTKKTQKTMEKYTAKYKKE